MLFYEETPMEKNINELLIETTVNQAIKRIQNDPERSTRNLVDIGLHFSNGKFQQRFLELLQKMLENEQSAYYRMIPDLMANIDSKRITTFGMNVGYHSCTKGARTIREMEEILNFNIPWCISLDIDGEVYWEHRDYYRKLIEDGEALGIYTWIIYSKDKTSQILELAELFPDSAFLYCCSPKEINNALLDEANNIYNIMFAVLCSDGIENACQLLRDRKFLYSVFYIFSKNDAPYIMDGQALEDLEILHPAFSIFIAERTCPQDIQVDIYNYLHSARLEQNYQTLPYDMVYDTLFIDKIISEDAITIHFNQFGQCCSLLDSQLITEDSIFEQTLVNFLKSHFPKKG